MGGSENLDAKIAELLALLNAPEEQGPKKPPDEEVQPLPEEISPPEEMSLPSCKGIRDRREMAREAYGRQPWLGAVQWLVSARGLIRQAQR